jgi:hypothetical protein
VRSLFVAAVGILMTEALPFKTTMTFTYGEPRQLAPGVVRIVANIPSP